MDNYAEPVPLCLASGCLPDIAVGKLPGIKTAGPNGHSADDHANGRAPGAA